MATVHIKVGSFWFWAIWKVATLLGSLFMVAVLLPSRGYSRLFILGLGLFVLFLANEEIAYGYASEEGIRYRRYVRNRLVPWNEVKAIRWNTSTRINVELRKGFLFRKTLWMETPRNIPLVTNLTEPPEVVRWLLVAKPEGSDGVLLEGPGV